MPGLVYSSDSDDNGTIRRSRLFRRVLGGGKVADVLLWRNRNVSAGLLIWMTVIWFLFEVVEYNFVTLVCHLLITTLLVIFICRTAVELFGLTPPTTLKIIVHESSTFSESFANAVVLSMLLETVDRACGKDLPFFFLEIISLYILSVIGSYFSFLSLLYLGFLCLVTLPFLYERFEDDVDRLAGKVTREIKRSYRNFDSQFLNKISKRPSEREENQMNS